MQQKSERRSNRDRTDATRADLIAAARQLFTEKSYSETGTPEIVARAGVTRGALYHHFKDKQALFWAVAEQEAEAVAAEIERAAPPDAQSPRDALLAGSDAYLDAMRAPGRTRLLLLDGPAVLGRAGMDEIDSRHGNRTLREGLVAAMRSGAIRKLPPDALTSLLAAAFDRAALAIDAGESPRDCRAVLAALIDGLIENNRPSPQQPGVRA
ncbi:TetR family transcriptional regulator [Mesorhizobium sp. Root554]|uniref:TetR/AcrR family transcriptional regulator n=1 Tax=unclassified Mesorhizobium TaxID=325217 RepID=UPI0006F54358|nr:MULTISPECIES: TetR/AcrR family transcriptional regulator [unclassified Mesorhizobium]KQZ14173.1 TetR family transcriptional regulator [Mesorhizobium sp. Root1471]KQZ36685.1 TetR family transcriptional regulator [Mesorhizobium sp. Root554]